MRKLLMFLGILYPLICSGEWWITTVDYFSAVGGNSIALDSSGIPHIAYTKNTGLDWSFKYVSWNSTDSSWTLEFANDSSSSPILRFDSKGLPHIMSYRGYYIYKDTTGTWEIEGNLPWNSNYGFDLDSKDYPHVMEEMPSLLDPDTFLFHWYKYGAGWHEEIITGLLEPHYRMGNGKRYIAMAIDDEDVIHIAYFSGQYGNEKSMHYAKKINGIWYKEPVDTPVYLYDECPSLALDTCGYPCVAYKRNPTSKSPPYELRFARKDSAGWKVEVVDTFSSCYAGLFSLCIGPDNYPRIAYRDGIACVKYAWFDGKSWNITAIDSAGLWPSLDMVVDEYGYSHICYDSYGCEKYAKGHGFMGVEESEELRVKSLELRVCPNPFTTGVRVQGLGASERQKVSLKIYDMVGRLVEETEGNIIGKNLPSGIYFVKVKGYKPTKIIKIGGIR